MSTRGIAWLAVVAVSAPVAAHAHTFKRSYAEIDVRGDGIEATVDVDPGDFDETLRARFDRDRSGIVDVPEMEADANVVGGIMAAGMVIERDHERCAARVEDAGVLRASRMVRVHITYTCEEDGPLRISMPLFERLQPGHVHLVVVNAPDGVRSGALTREQPAWEEETTGRWAVIGRFTLLGAEHILIGYDHMLFLLALLLVARGLAEIIRIVSAFTVAHSLTLVAAGLGWVQLPGRVVESAIALTIVAVAVQNVFIAAAGDGDRRGGQRWLLTFGLGLVHGFGFASVLGQMQLPPHDRVFPLLAFNVGVEMGQLLVVLVAIPALHALEAPFLSRRARLAILLGAAATGAVLWPLEPLCSEGIWALGLLAVALVPQLGFEWAMVYGGSATVAVVGGVWFVLRAFG